MLSTIWSRLRPWVEAGKPFALATVTSVEGSGPRAPGVCMAISADGKQFIGSASSGCLDGVVIDAARQVLVEGGVRRLRFGPDGQQPWSDGLTCGGWIDVRVEAWWGCHPNEAICPIGEAVREWLDGDGSGMVLGCGDRCLALNSAGEAVAGDNRVPARFIERGRGALKRESPSHELAFGNDLVFCHMVLRRPRLVMIGGVDATVHLIPFAHESGFSTIVVDPRTAFLDAERFPLAADEIRRGWPEAVVPEIELGPRDAAVTLTHDPKIDDQALIALLNTRIGYIGAMGSTRSHAARLDRLEKLGVKSAALDRIEGPAGIHLGVGSAAGIALGIMAGVARWSAASRQEALAVALTEKPTV